MSCWVYRVGRMRKKRVIWWWRQLYSYDQVALVVVAVTYTTVGVGFALDKSGIFDVSGWMVSVITDSASILRASVPVPVWSLFVYFIAVPVGIALREHFHSMRTRLLYPDPGEIKRKIKRYLQHMDFGADGTDIHDIRFAGLEFTENLPEGSIKRYVRRVMASMGYLELFDMNKESVKVKLRSRHWLFLWRNVLRRGYWKKKK